MTPRVAAALVFALGAATWLPAQAPAPVAPRPPVSPARGEPAVAFAVGERLAFDVGWSGLVTAGTATVVVSAREPTSDGGFAYRIVAEGEPIPLLQRLYTLHYRAETHLDTRTLLPRRGAITSREGPRQRTKITIFDQARGRARYEVRTATVVSKDVVTGDRAHDALSALFAMRQMRLQPGTQETLRVTDSGDLYRVRVRVLGREAVTTPWGPRQAWKLVPEIIDEDERREAARDIAIYLSDDTQHLPLRLKARLAVGTFSTVLHKTTP